MAKKFKAVLVKFVVNAGHGLNSKYGSYLGNPANSVGGFELEYHSPEDGPAGILYKRDRTADDGTPRPIYEFYPMHTVSHIEFDSADCGGLLDRSAVMDAADKAAEVCAVDEAVKAIEKLIEEADPSNFKSNGQPTTQAMAKLLKKRGISTEFVANAYAEYLKRRG